MTTIDNKTRLVSGFTKQARALYFVQANVMTPSGDDTDYLTNTYLSSV